MRRALVLLGMAGLAALLGFVLLRERRAATSAPRPIATSLPPIDETTSGTAKASSPVPAPASAQAPGELAKPDTEDAFLRELERLHMTDKPRALAFAKKGEEWYASTGRPAEARKAMIVTLLVELGDMEEARNLTRRFIDAYPESEYRPLVQGLTGIHPRPHGPRGIEY